MDSNNLRLEVEMNDKVQLEAIYQDLSVINGKSIKRIETVSQSTESDGVSIYNIYRDDDLVLGTLYIKNGSKGDKGDIGITGNGILSIVQTQSSTDDKGENILTITDTDGNQYLFKVLNGSKGSQGIQGIQGESIESVRQTKTSTESEGENIITVELTNGQTFNFSVYNGRQGIQGLKGDTGVGISSMEQTKVSVEDNGENIFTFTTSDGNIKQFSIRNGSKGSQGEPFQIKKVYTSISSMNAGYSTDGLPVGSFVIIDTGSVEDADTGKLYVKSDSGYSYITDLSGSQGIQGPQGIAGVGVSSVEQTITSTEDSGNNVVTITLTDGTTQTINVKNGSKGSKGDKGDTGPAVPLVQTTGTSTTDAMSQNAVTEALKTKAPKSHNHVKNDITDFAHNHDDIYYTENEIDTKVNQLKSDLDNKINYSDSLSYEEIIAENLTGKVASANALKTITDTYHVDITLTDGSTSIIQRYGKLCIFTKMIVGNIFQNGNNWQTLFRIPSSCTPKYGVYFPIVMYNPEGVAYGLIENGLLRIYPTNYSSINSNTQYHVFAVWLTN